MEEAQIIKYMRTKKYVDGKYVCWDFVMDIYRDLFGIELPEYPVGEVQAEFKNKLMSNFEHVKIERGDEKEGDIVVFSLFGNQLAGVVIVKENFIHLSHCGVKVAKFSMLVGNYKIYRIIK